MLLAVYPEESVYASCFTTVSYTHLMADTLKKVLTEYGVDMKKTMERFVGDEDLYAECLTKFLSDSSWPLIRCV